MEDNNRLGKTRALFKEIRDNQGTFYAKMGTVKDRNGMNLTEAKEISPRNHTSLWQPLTFKDQEIKYPTITQTEPTYINNEITHL